MRKFDDQCKLKKKILKQDWSQDYTSDRPLTLVPVSYACKERRTEGRKEMLELQQAV